MRKTSEETREKNRLRERLRRACGDKSRLNAISAQWRANNPERNRAVKALWYKRNAEAVKRKVANSPPDAIRYTVMITFDNGGLPDRQYLHTQQEAPMAKQRKRQTKAEKVGAAAGVGLEEALSFESPESSSIASASYDPIHETLTVWFKRSGGINQGYDYTGFPLKMWTEFYMAASKGAYFGNAIRPMFAGRVRV